jgi:hypothetical protein
MHCAWNTRGFGLGLGGSSIVLGKSHIYMHTRIRGAQGGLQVLTVSFYIVCLRQVASVRHIQDKVPINRALELKRRNPTHITTGNFKASLLSSVFCVL